MYDLHQAVLTALLRGRGSPTELIDWIEEDSKGVIHLGTPHIRSLLWGMERQGLILSAGAHYEVTDNGRALIEPPLATGS